MTCASPRDPLPLFGINLEEGESEWVRIQEPPSKRRIEAAKEEAAKRLENRLGIAHLKLRRQSIEY